MEKADVLEDGTVRLDAQLDPKENCHSFAVTEIICQEDLETNLRVGHNDGLFIWLNKELIYEYPSTHGFKYNEFSVPIKLNKGKNILGMIIMQAEGSWLFNFNMDSNKFNNQIPNM